MIGMAWMGILPVLLIGLWVAVGSSNPSPSDPWFDYFQSSFHPGNVMPFISPNSNSLTRVLNVLNAHNPTNSRSYARAFRRQCQRRHAALNQLPKYYLGRKKRESPAQLLNVDGVVLRSNESDPNHFYYLSKDHKWYRIELSDLSNQSKPRVQRFYRVQSESTTPTQISTSTVKAVVNHDVFGSPFGSITRLGSAMGKLLKKSAVSPVVKSEPKFGRWLNREDKKKVCTLVFDAEKVLGAQDKKSPTYKHLEAFLNDVSKFDMVDIQLNLHSQSESAPPLAEAQDAEQDVFKENLGVPVKNKTHRAGTARSRNPNNVNVYLVVVDNLNCPECNKNRQLFKPPPFESFNHPTAAPTDGSSATLMDVLYFDYYDPTCATCRSSSSPSTLIPLNTTPNPKRQKFITIEAPPPLKFLPQRRNTFNGYIDPEHRSLSGPPVFVPLLPQPQILPYPIDYGYPYVRHIVRVKPQTKVIPLQRLE